jgi:hypothetical protein
MISPRFPGKNASNAGIGQGISMKKKCSIFCADINYSCLSF